MVAALLADSELVWGLAAVLGIVPVVPVLVLETIIRGLKVSLQAFVVILHFEVHPALHESQRITFLCATSVFSVSLWFITASKNNHRGTENTEVAQRRSPIRDFSCKAGSSECIRTIRG